MNPAVDNGFNARVRRDEPMSRHTSWHVGGPAEVFFTPRDREDLTAFLRELPAGIPIHWIGLGSNLLVRDGGLPGVVVSTRGTLDVLERVGGGADEGEVVLAGVDDAVGDGPGRCSDPACPVAGRCRPEK